MCVKYNVSIFPSLSLILKPIKGILIIGDTRSNSSLAIEESTKIKEVSKQNQEQNGWNIDALIRYTATKQRVVEGLVRCNIAHIAANANLKSDALHVNRGSILLAVSDSDLFEFIILI